jgi:hypothetical protein
VSDLTGYSDDELRAIAAGDTLEQEEAIAAALPMSATTPPERSEIPHIPGLGLTDIAKGIYEGAKRTVMLPRQVLDREIDPRSPEGMRRTTEAATFMTPLSAASRAGAVFAKSQDHDTSPRRANG